MELIKKQIHMNQFKGTVTTQITLDDDFIVPDTMDDMAQVMLDTGEIQIESVKNQGEKVAVKGKLEFQVLYRKEGGGLQTLGGSIPFDETINAPDLEEKDYVGLNWMLEDLNAEMINSRKLGVQAIITLQVRIETLRDVEAAVDVDMGNGGFAAQTPGDGGSGSDRDLKAHGQCGRHRRPAKGHLPDEGGDFPDRRQAQHRPPAVAGDEAAGRDHQAPGREITY